MSLYAGVIAVNGTMSATNDTFTNTGGGSYIAVNSGGELSASNSTFNLAQLSLDNNSKLLSTDLTGDVFNTPFSLPYNDVQFLANNASFNDVQINPGTLPSGVELTLNQIGTNSSSLRYDFLSAFTVAAGATLAVGPNVSVLVQSSTLTDGGALTFASGDKVSLNVAVIAVNGTMSATNDTFTNIGGGSFITVNSGGEMAASNSTFTLAQLSLDNNSKLKSTDLAGDVFDTPFSLPYNDVQYLGNNASFDDIDINPGTLPSGTLSLDQIGTNSSSLRYVFLSGFTVAAGATLAVGPNVSVLIQSSTLTDGGSLTFGSGDKVSLNGGAIAVNGTMSATSDTFTNIGGGSYITVNSGGELAASNSTFTLAQLSLDNNSKLKSTDLTGDVFATPFSLPYNDVQFLANNASFNDIEINAGTLPSGTLSLNQIGTNSSSLRYDVLSGFTVAAGATLAVGPNVSVLIESTLTAGGSLTFASGDTVSLYAGVIAVNGTMSATNDTFTNTGAGSYIAVNSGGELVASNSTFTLAQLSLDNNSKLNGTDLAGDVFKTPVSLPYNDVQYLGNNASFDDIDINAGTIPSGTLSLNQIGTNTSNLRYVFPGEFTVASGATFNVGANVSVLIESDTHRRRRPDLRLRRQGVAQRGGDRGQRDHVRHQRYLHQRGCRLLHRGQLRRDAHPKRCDIRFDESDPEFRLKPTH